MPDKKNLLRAIPFEKLGAGMSAFLKKIPWVGGLNNFPIPRVGSLIFWAILVGGGMLGTPQYFIEWSNITKSLLLVLPIIHI